MDMRAFGKEFDEYYNRAQNEYGIRFVRSRIAAVAEDPKTKNLCSSTPRSGEPKEEVFNLVVLAVGLRPPADAENAEQDHEVQAERRRVLPDERRSRRSRPRGRGYSSAARSPRPRTYPMTVAEASGAAAKAAHRDRHAPGARS